MDNLLNLKQDVPALSQEKLEQMTELALSYRQHVPGNENRKLSLFSFRWAGVMAAACVVLAVGAVTLQNSPLQPAPQNSVAQNPIVAAKAPEPTAIAVVSSEEIYEDLSDLALLQTLESF